MDQWKQLREEYVTGEASCRELGEKYGIDPAVVSRRAVKEQWTCLRKLHRSKELGKNRKEDPVSGLQEVADKLLLRVENWVEDQETLDVKDLRALVSALKDLVAIREACPELERQARIAELEEKLEGPTEDLRVVFQAGEEAWNA